MVGYPSVSTSPDHPCPTAGCAKFCAVGKGFSLVRSNLERQVRCSSTGVLSKCANQHCAAPFLYFRSGKLFHFPRSEQRRATVPLVFESFWLCDECSRELTLAWQPELGVITLPLNSNSPTDPGSFSQKNGAPPYSRAPLLLGSTHQTNASDIDGLVPRVKL